MAGKSPVAVSGEQKAGLRRLAASRDRAEADRARALLLTLSGWTSPRIAEAFRKGQDRSMGLSLCRSMLSVANLAASSNRASSPAGLSGRFDTTARANSTYARFRSVGHGGGL